jgi:hypothetical protein
MESVYHIVAIRVNETSWAHVWRLHFCYLGTGYDNYGFPELVHSGRLEQLGKGLVVLSSEIVAAHWVDEPVAEASTSRSLGAAPVIEPPKK